MLTFEIAGSIIATVLIQYVGLIGFFLIAVAREEFQFFNGIEINSIKDMNKNTNHRISKFFTYGALQVLGSQ
jgi:hypothetical protein